MFQLVYISTARQPRSGEALQRILAESRRNNAAAGITGILLVGGKRFLQVLEGPEDAVRALYQRIRSDPRHFACVTLSQRRIDGPEFGEWAMGCEGASCEHVLALADRIADKSLRAQFVGFAELHAKAA